MGTRLVTIATFDLAAQARLAQNALQEAGIQAAVNDETLVAMEWVLSNAVGGIKVQVREEDAERAVVTLEVAFGKNGERLGTAVDPDQFAAEAEAAPRDPDEPPDDVPSAPPAVPGPEAEEPASPDPYSRDGYAKRLVFTAWLGLGFPPLVFYTPYLFLNAAFGAGELSPRGRYNLFVGGLIVALPLLIWLTVLRYMLSE